MTLAGSDIRLRPARIQDWPLIRRWLALPDVIAWWGPVATTEAEVLVALKTDSAITRLIMVGDDPVGYGHAIDATLWGAALPAELEPLTWDVDLFIAEPRHRGVGVGPRALQLLADEVFETTLATAVCVFPALANERAVRAYEKAGFRWKRVWNDPVMGPSWFMTRERPPMHS